MRWLRILALTVGVLYLLFRVGFTFDGANPLLFVALLAAEAFGLVRFAVESSLLGEPRPPRSDPHSVDPIPSDAIVVVTDEPASEVRAAVLSARILRGVASITIVDRDDRPEIAQLARRLGLTRFAGGVDADLGALTTRAIGVGSAPLLVMLNADSVVLPDATTVTAAAFADPEIGVVVARVEATNAQSGLDHGGYGQHRLRDELVNGKLDDQHALPWWPGPAIVRRQAIEEIGGMAPGRDLAMMATGVRLQVAGWRMTDVPVVVARRLAPANDVRHVHRWSRELHERLSVLRRKDISWRSPRLTRPMRVAYLSALVSALRAPQRLVLAAILLISLVTSALPLVGSPLAIGALWGAWMTTSIAVRFIGTRSVGWHPWITSDHRLLTTELAIFSRVLLRRRVDVDLVDEAPGLKLRAPVLIGLEFMLLAVMFLLAIGVLRARHGDFAMAALLGFAVVLMVVLVQAIESLRHGQRRQGYRAYEDLPPLMSSNSDLSVTGVSPFGIDVVSPTPLQVGENVRLAFALPRGDGSAEPFDSPMSVRRARVENGMYRAYLRFAQLADGEMDRLFEYCAVVSAFRTLRGMPVPVASSLSAIEGDALGSGAAIVPAARVGARVAKGNGL